MPGLQTRNEYQYEGAKDEDEIKKEKGRVFTGRKINATEHIIEEGDVVLMKNTRKKTKYDPNFDPRSLIVTERS